jgi:myosin-1
LAKSVENLKKIHRRWRAYHMLKPYSEAERAVLRLKVYAFDNLNGKRRQWGCSRKWLGNYLADPQENRRSSDAISSINRLQSADHFNNVLFACLVKKTNRFVKCADRAICVTDTHIYKLNPSSRFQKMKNGIPISEVVGLSVSPGPDTLACIHLTGGNDLVLCLYSSLDSATDLIGELVGTMAHFFTRIQRREMKVNVATNVACTLGNRPKAVTVGVVDNGLAAPIFRKNGNAIILNFPQISHR